eukprot:11457520-Alexandrium_andersonii.AAC.1
MAPVDASVDHRHQPAEQAHGLGLAAQPLSCCGGPPAELGCKHEPGSRAVHERTYILPGRSER